MKHFFFVIRAKYCLIVDEWIYNCDKIFPISLVSQGDWHQVHVILSSCSPQEGLRRHMTIFMEGTPQPALLRFPDRKLSVVDKMETNLMFIIVLWPKSGIYLK